MTWVINIQHSNIIDALHFLHMGYIVTNLCAYELHWNYINHICYNNKATMWDEPTACNYTNKLDPVTKWPSLANFPQLCDCTHILLMD